ncbi:hypothetical protein [Marinospirillum alkaliphilum]|uniref:DUF3617 family protein n=1 Tax=Marinospirillum alkaliphilum DSM 21637 TaxID=1122209 RepID=A0A1K1YZY6_9GAMM|nr:hypothetical protein [Marinospirillum alkaliphilum]SFX67003.1 hypothetical protein SAMN02745752_02476 [Marinospirillum alkaliphilum DSM 21637]
MKKLFATLTLMSCSFGLLAQETLPLQSGQLLDSNPVSKVVLQEGQSKTNVWFAVETHRVEGSSNHKLSNCTLSTDLALENGRLNLQTRQMRCISTEGEIFTDKAIQAELTASTSEICTSSGGSKCSEVTLQAGQNYVFEVRKDTNLIAEYNPSREVNRIRMEQGF